MDRLCRPAPPRRPGRNRRCAGCQGDACHQVQRRRLPFPHRVATGQHIRQPGQDERCTAPRRRQLRGVAADRGHPRKLGHRSDRRCPRVGLCRPGRGRKTAAADFQRRWALPRGDSRYPERGVRALGLRHFWSDHRPRRRSLHRKDHARRACARFLPRRAPGREKGCSPPASSSPS